MGVLLGGAIWVAKGRWGRGIQNGKTPLTENRRQGGSIFDPTHPPHGNGAGYRGDQAKTHPTSAVHLLGSRGLSLVSNLCEGTIPKDPESLAPLPQTAIGRGICQGLITILHWGWKNHDPPTAQSPRLVTKGGDSQDWHLAIPPETTFSEPQVDNLKGGVSSSDIHLDHTGDCTILLTGRLQSRTPQPVNPGVGPPGHRTAQSRLGRARLQVGK